MIVSDETRPSLHRHAALKRRAEGDVLVLPERAIRLGGSGGEILHLCNGERSQAEIVAILRSRYAGGDALAPPEPGSALSAAVPEGIQLEASDIAAEVRRFLGEMLELGGVSVEPAADQQDLT